MSIERNECQVSIQKNWVINEGGRPKIIVSEGSVRVIPDRESNAPIHPEIITILPGIQLQLGRSIQQFIKEVQYTKRPIIFTQMINSPKKGVSAYKVTRVATGRVPERDICVINCFQGAIIGVMFSQELNYDKEYKTYERLSITHQLTLGKLKGEITHEVVSEGVHTISFLTHIPENRIDVRHSPKGILFRLPGMISYEFYLDKNGYLNLLNIQRMI